jgi:hypothetical protein
MALNRYVLTSTVTVAAGTAATVVAGEPGTGGAAGYGNGALAAGQVDALWPTTFIKGTPIMLDPAGALFAAIGSGNLKAFTAAQDSSGIDGVSN